MQTCMNIQDGRATWEITGVENPTELLPQLENPLVSLFYPRLDKTNVHIRMMRHITLIERAYPLITSCVSPKLLQIIRNLCMQR